MAKNTRNDRKRKDPMPGLIILAVLMALVVAGAIILGNMIRDYRADLLSSKKQEVIDRNEGKYAVYEQEFKEYEEKLNQSNSSVNEAWPTPKQEGWDVLDLSNYPLEVPMKVNVQRADIMNNGLLLVNEWHSRPNDFDDTAVVSASGFARNITAWDNLSFWDDSSCRLLPVALEAVSNMLLDAKAVGLEYFVLQKGYTYRSYEDQQELFDDQVAAIRRSNPDYTEEQLVNRAKRSINYPGTSEFNTGLAFRIHLYNGEDRTLGNTAFYETAQGKWLYENSWKYGIVFRFPVEDYPVAGVESKAYKTGVNGKQNTYRYVGVANAEIMHHLNLCLEEYIEYLMDHPHVAVFENGVKKYEVTRQQVGDDATSFVVEINRLSPNYTMYLDNMGGVITVYTF